ncbi:hypothetical protein [Vibrio diazotrophicus]|uniref:hypothetical protein n=1 Tax=Vibrio diazotrophicus TaxID=685 RepID=UPI003D2F7491
MLNKMQQDGQAQMQETFNRIMQKSIQQSGAQVDPNDVPGSLGGIIAFAMAATVEEAQKHKKQVPAQIVIQSAVDIAQQALAQFNIPEEQMDELLSQIFEVAMQQFLAMSQQSLAPEELAKYEQFMQMVSQGMQQQPEQPPQQQAPMGGM